MRVKYISVDVEADGPCPGLYSMISFGAVLVEGDLNKTFYGKLKPISDMWVPEALVVSGFTREETMEFDDPLKVMTEFKDWLDSLNCRPMFLSDNNGFDWQYINYYFHLYLRKNPFGFSSTNLGSLYKGVVKDMFKNFKHLRKTKHSHHPVEDAKGNAEAFIEIMKIGIRW